MMAHSPFEGIEAPVICIMGPTACGKTALAFELYDRADIDIISVDSALVYRDMNIGTAKPTQDELRAYPHALVDIIDPTGAYSAAAFARDARTLIMQSHAKGRTPVLVGGTMLYFKALFGGLNDIPASQPDIREQLNQQVKQQGIAALYAQLQINDPKLASQLNPTDTQRILRGLEVFEITGKPMSSFHLPKHVSLPKQWIVTALMPERGWLHERIALRLSMMWKEDFVDEVQFVLKKYQIDDEMPAMRAVGYRQVCQYLKIIRPSDGDRQIMEDKALFATRQLAKRQYTWLRKFNKNYDLRVFDTNSQAKQHLINSLV